MATSHRVGMTESRDWSPSPGVSLYQAQSDPAGDAIPGSERVLNSDVALVCEAQFAGGGDLRAQVFKADVFLGKRGDFSVDEMKEPSGERRVYSGEWIYGMQGFTLHGSGHRIVPGVDRDPITGRVVSNPYSLFGPRPGTFTRYIDLSVPDRVTYVVDETGYGRVSGFCVLRR